MIVGLTPSGQRRVNGPVVLALQIALNRQGQAITADGDFGNGTATALKAWQGANGMTPRDSIDADGWRKLTGLEPPSIFDHCLTVTSDFEGTSFDRVVGNFDGAGITFGLIGFTLVNGELGRLLAAIDAAAPGTLADAFGPLHSKLMSVLASSKAERLAWADSVSTGSNKYGVKADWKDAFAGLGKIPAARRAQVERAYDHYWTAARKHMKSFSEPTGVADYDAALWYDVAVQNSLDDGELAQLSAAASSGNVGGPLRRDFAEIIALGSASAWQNDVRKRKTTFVAGKGSVHGSDYDIMFWGIDGRALSAAELDAPSRVIDIVSG